ncbi:hypothetical protein Tco_0351491 [Tanacetum coccineum]
MVETSSTRRGMKCCLDLGSQTSPKAQWIHIGSPQRRIELLLISQSPRGIFINQSKYALESLKKYGFDSYDPVDTSMVEKSKLDKDKEGKAVDPSHYREHAEFDESNAKVLERFYTSAGSLAKEILLKLNLPDHRILKDGGEGT